MNILTAYLLISLLSGIAIYCIHLYDKWRYGECIELKDGGIIYSKSIIKGVPYGRAIRSRSFAPNVTKGATLLSLTHKN